MIETLGTIVLWLLVVVGVVGGAFLWLVDSEASRVGGVKQSRFPKIMLILGVALAAVMLTACADTKRVAEHLPTPPERLICERVGTRPTIPPEHQIDWSQVRTVPAARLEHEKYVATVRTREGVVAGYVLKLEGVNFVCWNNMEWRRQFEAGLGG